MKRKSNTVLAFGLFICTTFFVEVYAQYDDRDRHPYDFSPGLPPGGDDPDPAGGDDPDPAAPIDDYIPLLIVSGLVLAYFVIKNKNKVSQ